MNGSPYAEGEPVTNWPALSNRNLGLVIGNTTAYDASINGQFEEMETFNYQLSAGEISSNFTTIYASILTWTVCRTFWKTLV